MTTAAKQADDYWPLRERTKETATHHQPTNTHPTPTDPRPGCGGGPSPHGLRAKPTHTTHNRPRPTAPHTEDEHRTNQQPQHTNTQIDGECLVGSVSEKRFWVGCVTRGYVHVDVRVVFGGLCRRTVAGGGFTHKAFCHPSGCHCRIPGLCFVSWLGSGLFVALAGSCVCSYWLAESSLWDRQTGMTDRPRSRGLRPAPCKWCTP